MSLYRISIKPITSFCSPLQSDTFFGAFCWSYLYNFGEDSLRELLYNYKIGMPDIIFSNAFPCGTIPMPIGLDKAVKKQEGSFSKEERYQKYIENKRMENISKISLRDFNRIINGVIEFSSNNMVVEHTYMNWRNLVNRETNTVGNIEGEGNLFEIEEIYTTGAYDIYIYSTLAKDILDCTLKDMFCFGIGAQRSVGKGAFEIFEELEVFHGFNIPESPNAFVALSNFIPQKDDPTDGYYKAFVKYPKVSYISSEGDSPFKKPLIFLKAGSVFFDQPIKTFYGSCIEKVALKGGSISDEIIIGAYTIAIPCYVDRAYFSQ